MINYSHSVSPKEREMEDKDPVHISLKWLKHLAAGATGQEIEARTLQGLQVVQARKGYFLCTFVVPDRASDENGNWHAGAIATLIDVVGAAAVFSLAGHINVSVDFSVSFYSTVKIDEQVEIEAKIAGVQGKMTSVVVEVRRQNKGELVALGKQWMVSNFTVNVNQVSKL
ncbi:hypothetical protein HS088_TW22G00555 [Tripterygium wilfordii]|uniref:Acyl-coenzyme A thioesterase 13 n=1 Tax=Tripterygium wilfordii TaxID=458696 RepID=A0A7J7BY90_TRIWF|nr:uncharacterized protein LOC119992076 [Tripterygium wilfordii]KAF5726870.1 hypothetical protein HS088_TW22G00555 [Tripterygium wilfordii]